MFLHEIGGVLWLTLWRCWLHGILECSFYSNVHFTSWMWFSAQGWLYKLWHMLFLFWSGFSKCMVESWARRLSLCLACKPFPGLCECTRTGRWCACTRNGRWWASVVVIRPLSLFTNRADRRSQINSIDSWCTIPISKMLDVVHGYALLVSNSDKL